MKLEINGLSFSYGKEPLFDNFSLLLRPGQTTALLGPSGCGKTSLLRLIAGLITPSGGCISLDRTPESDSTASAELSSCEDDEGPLVSFVFQEPRLLAWRSILQNVTIPIEASLGKKQARERALHFLDAVGLSSKAASLPSELSGGQRQRVSVARAFAYPAPLVLMDEPFQSLDLPLRLQLMDLTLDLIASEKRLALAVTHDPREAIYLAKRALVIAGKPVCIVLDEAIELDRADRAYASSASAELEARLFASLCL